MNDFSCLEELVTDTGHCARTVRLRLEAANVKPVKKDGRKILYPRAPALRAILTGGENSAENRAKIEFLEHTLVNVLIPRLFEGSFSQQVGNFMTIGLKLSDECTSDAMEALWKFFCDEIEAFLGRKPGEIDFEPPSWARDYNA
ncbi:hypothetical protein EWI61_08980 [Methylolobus aquaticus]|nr:hypothetical protein EWI61_08980 [Methylolobus aquaticus]